MKLQCQVEVVNRLHSTLNPGPRGKYLKSTLALGKEPKNPNEVFILHFSTVNKTGIKYKVKHMKQVFAKFLNEGKATLRFEEPPYDLCIKSESIQLKCFMKLLQKCVTGDTKMLENSSLCNVSVTAKDVAPTKLVIRDRSEFPSKGLPRTLESLTLAGLKLCNFRRDVLMLKQLTVLDLSNNEIEKLPPELGRMPCLSELKLANNKLGENYKVDWRWLLGDQMTKSLRLLDISGNRLKMLPNAIWKLQRLVTLNVQDNELEDLPDSIGRITTLRYFTVSKNKLTSLPCSLMHCRLEHIDISDNELRSDRDYPLSWKHFSPWKVCVGNLVQVSAQVILKHKFYYAPNIIPWTLVEYLDNAHMCVCGNPALTEIFSMDLHFDPKEYFRTVVWNDNMYNVKFGCYFCSFKCFKKVCPLFRNNNMT